MKRLAFACLLLGACASPQSYDDTLRAWKGHDEQTLVQTWGPPQQVYETNGKRVLTYYREHDATHAWPSIEYDYVTGGVNTTYQYVPETLACVTNFYFEDGRIIMMTYRGNAC